MTPPGPLFYLPGWAAAPSAFAPVQAACGGTILDWRDCLDPALGALGRALESAAAPAVIVGWSLGGQLALRAAYDYPDRVAGLILLSTTPRFTAQGDWPGTPEKRLRAMRQGLHRDAEAVLSDFWRRCAAPGEAELGDHYRQQVGLAPTAPGLDAGLAWLAGTDLRPALADIKIPVRLLHGEDDAIVPVQAAAILANALPVARLDRLAGGHGLALEKPGLIRDSLQALAHDL